MYAPRPDARALTQQRREAEYAHMARMAHRARWVNRAAVLFCLVLSLDWALPMQQFPDEPILEKRLISVGSYLSNPQMAYRIRTPHTRFKLRTSQAYRIRGATRVTVWRTPLLRVVQLIKAPAVVAGREPFVPYRGSIYNSLTVLFPVALLLTAGVGLLLPFEPETRLNTAIVSGLLWLVTLAILLLS